MEKGRKRKKETTSKLLSAKLKARPGSALLQPRLGAKDRADSAKDRDPSARGKMMAIGLQTAAETPESEKRVV